MELLVRVVDAQLLERVEREHLKAKDIEKPRVESARLTRFAVIIEATADACVHASDDPVKQTHIDRLDRRIAGGFRLRDSQLESAERAPARLL